MYLRRFLMKPAVFRPAPPLRGAGIFLAALVCLLVSAAQADSVVNPPSAWPVTVDGQFSGGLDRTGAPVGEWSDVTPQAFITRATDGTLLRTTRADARKTSLLWAAVSPPAGGAPGALKLHLLYEALTTTPRAFAPGETLADLTFPLRIDGFILNVTLHLEAVATPGPTSQALAPEGVAYYDVLLILEGVKVPAKRFSLAAAAGFGPSPFNRNNHLLVEAAIPLVIPAGYGPGFPADGLAGNGRGLGYLPEPAYWQAVAAPSRSAPLRLLLPPPLPPSLEAKALFRVNPDASLTLSADLLPLPDCSATAVLACPPDLVLTTSAGLDPLRVDYPLPLVPACLGLHCDPPPGSVFPVGVTTVTCTLTPATGPATRCSFTVTVAPPGLPCPAPITVPTAPGKATARVRFTVPAPPGTAVLCTPPSGSAFPLGTTIVRCRTTGGASLSACEFPVTVVDREPPRFTFCPPDLTVECGRGIGPEKTGQARATDNAGPVHLTYTDEKSNGPQPIVKNILRTWTATDAAGNQTTCRQHITIRDTQGPKIHRLLAIPAAVVASDKNLIPVQLEEIVEDSCSTLAQLTRRLQVTVKDPAGTDHRSYFSITGADKLFLRPKKGVVYTITLQCGDFFGNTTSRSVTVPVN